MIAVLKAYCDGLGLGLSADESTPPELVAVLKEAGLGHEDQEESE